MQDRLNTFLGILSFSVAKVTLFVLCRRNRLKKFEEVGRIHSINLFPLKSGGPIHLESAKCTVTGLLCDGVKDRHWMVIRKDSAFLSGRLEPKLVLIKSSIRDTELHLDAPGMTTLVLPKFPIICKTSKLIKCRVWDDYIIGLHCGEEAEKWIQKYLGYEGPSIVVTTNEMAKRDSSLAVKPNYNPAIKGDLAAFADFGAYMILSESSLDDLNSRLEKKVTMTSFRPNITITGCKAYDEDSWLEMRIGDSVFFRLLDLCARCSLTTVDPYIGVKDPTRQPLETLKSYRFRKEYDSACFGVNAALDTEGDIKVGDPVYVLRR